MLDELFIRGGPVLYILFGLTFLIFTLLVDKYLFIFVQSKTWVNAKFTSFVNSNPPSSTKYKFVEATLISNVKRKTASNIKVLDGLIGMTPMIGLLGTVYGMIEVFEVLSFMGTGNPRAMSSGVAKATIPTMAGMVISLFGLYFFGHPIFNIKLNFADASINEFDILLLPSPIHANFFPEISPLCSSKVRMSEITWHGWLKSDKPLMRGIVEYLENSSRFLCFEVLIIIISAYSERTFAVSFKLSSPLP